MLSMDMVETHARGVCVLIQEMVRRGLLRSEATDKKRSSRRQNTLFVCSTPSAHPNSEDSSDMSTCVSALKSECSDDVAVNTSLTLSLTPCCLQLPLVNTSSTAPSIAYQVDLDLLYQLRLAVL